MKSLLRLTLIIMILGVGLFFISRYLVSLNSTHLLSQVLARYHWLFIVWRYLLYALVIALWPYFTGLLGRRQNWSAEVIQYVSNQRLKMLGLFVIIEAFFSYNLIGHLFTWI